MSLHKFAEQVAQHGRGDDSLLVHMTPDEVRNLQRFAEANGTTLTINPQTGLPEAGLLSDLFKAVAPIALGAFLGPAGFGLSSAMAGVATGGITALATGSLSRGLMAGLGAYGGAGLGESLMTAGGGMSAANAATTAQQQLSGANLALGEAMPAQAAEQFTKDAVARMTPSGAVSAGIDKAIASPMDFAKANYKPLLAAASPIMAGLMVPTTTQVPQGESRGNIRQMAFNINPDTGKPDPLYGVREMAPVKASEWGDKTFQGQRDLFYKQNPNPYELGVGSLNQPPQQQPARMADGGIVALADGGKVQHFYLGGDVKGQLEQAYAANDVAKINEIAKANMVTADEVAKTWEGFDTSGIKGLQLYTPPSFGDSVKAMKADIAAGGDGTGNLGGGGSKAPTYTQYSDQQFADYFAKTPNADIAKDTITYNADPAAVNRYIASLTSPFVGSTDTKGGSGTLGIYNQMVAQNIDPNEYYAAALANDPKYAGWTKEMIQKGYNLDKGAYALSSQLGGKVADKDWVNFMDTNKYSIDDMAQAFGLSRNEVRDRYNAVKNAEKKTTVITNTGGTGTGATGVIPGGNYGNATNPGDITTNPDGTVTVHPNLPFRPPGGYSGMGEVKDAYTKGGGSLGYTAKAPKTIEEFNQLYNRQTGDSLAAYDYLMGKGGGKYPVKSGVSQIAVPYNEFVLGKKTTKPAGTTKTTGSTVTGVPGQPQTYFDEAAYLAANPDVAAELKTGKSVSGQPTQFKSGYEHYLMYGKAGGRPFAGDYQGYLTALALAGAAGAGGGGEGPSGPGTSGPGGFSNNEANSITGLAQAPNNSIPDTVMGPDAAAAAAAAAATAADSAAASAASATGNAPGSDGSPGSGAKRGGLMPRGYAIGGGLGSLGSYSDGGRLLKGPGDGVSDSIPATIGRKQQPARLADGEFVIPARIVSELGNGSTDAGAKKLYAMMDRVQRARGKTTGKNKVAANSRADKHLPA